ncbi:MAG: MerR family transcriptional regulator [Kurthia sp.]|nr:MerR family transcriptional regulator [Candidatus Kurthia equi]
MENNYYTVGQMAKLSNLSNQTLRYYDQIDLFKPIFIDEQTNYRYYAESQLYLLDLIKSLRFIGTPLDKIKEVQHFTIEELITYLNEQELAIEQQIARLQETQHTLRKTRTQMEEQLAIPVMNEVFDKYEQQERLLCLDVKDSTPAYVSNEDMLKLTETIESVGSVQTIRYGGQYPLQMYPTLNDIRYEQIYIPILTSRQFLVQRDDMEIVTMPEGRYLEIAFLYTEVAYMEMYEKLWNYIKVHHIDVNPRVWESIMPTNFSPKEEEQLMIELKVKIR